MLPLRSALLAVSVLAVGGVAFAQSSPPAPATEILPTYDATQLPAFKGRIAQYTLTPRGDVDGLMLDDGTQIQIPPFFSTQVVYVAHPGDGVTVHGLKARALPLVAAMSLTNDASNVTVTLSGFGAPPGGPHGPRGPEQMLEATGRVKAQLHGPRGELNGVVLEDQTVVHLPPPEAERLAGTLAIGQTLYARGEGAALPYGRVIGADMIGTTKADAKEVAGPHGGMHGWMHGMLHGMGHHGPGPHGLGSHEDVPPPQ